MNSMTNSNLPKTPCGPKDLWSLISIVNYVQGLLYFIDSDNQILASNHKFREQVDNHSKNINYEKLATALDLDQEEQETILEGDYLGFFSDKLEEKDLLIEREGLRPRYFKIYRQAIKGEDHKKIIGLLVMINEQEPVPEKVVKPIESKVEIVLDKAPRVLIVEDNKIAQMYNRRIFIKNHCEVDVAGSEEEALALFDANIYDLILMDLGLPDSPGRIATKHIRANEDAEGKTKVPVIALTSSEARDVLSDCKRYQMNGFIHKPIKSHQAAQLIEYYVCHKDVKVDEMIFLDE